MESTRTVTSRDVAIALAAATSNSTRHGGFDPNSIDSFRNARIAATEHLHLVTDLVVLSDLEPGPAAMELRRSRLGFDDTFTALVAAYPAVTTDVALVALRDAWPDIGWDAFVRFGDYAWDELHNHVRRFFADSHELHRQEREGVVVAFAPDPPGSSLPATTYLSRAVRHARVARDDHVGVLTELISHYSHPDPFLDLDDLAATMRDAGLDVADAVAALVPATGQPTAALVACRSAWPNRSDWFWTTLADAVVDVDLDIPTQLPPDLALSADRAVPVHHPSPLLRAWQAIDDDTRAITERSLTTASVEHSDIDIALA